MFSEEIRLKFNNFCLNNKIVLRFFLIFFIYFIVTKAYSHDYKNAEHCDKIDKGSKGNWSVTNYKYEFLHVINRTKRKDLLFNKIKLNKPLNYYSGINIKTKDTTYPLCFDYASNVTTVLIEEKDLYNQIDRITDKHLMFHFHTSVHCGSPCLVSHVYTYSINKRTKSDWFHGLTISEGEFPSNWFVDHLTFKEAYKMHKYHDYDLYWRGKWYTIN